ncbi:hypothetical protein [Sulfuricystis multivorans]|uniref:hypothetical protein n=1 Tax=Sulfuricystis multivorans TaxID=2211108 RepID=UPI000F817906|nr:hypothetical protein [Sulfuricystis multivorans]
MQAIILYPGGEINSRELPDDEKQRLQLLKDLVGGHLEVVPVPGAKYLVFWEEVKDSPHLINEIATVIAREAESIQSDDYLAGVVVVVPWEALS